ncbi:MAG TPA: tetratricopeptide repeat protein [Gemmatimonadaceae bacterium]|nr:tetratricopeptide repeat protein [Gemmatimonadaceae bacterium]
MTNPELMNLEADEPLDLMEWVQANTRWISIGAAVVVLAGAGWWIYTQSKVRKEQNAAQALFLAKQSMQAGNLVLAQSDLSKLVNRYEGTSAGSEGAMILAQINFDQGKFQEGITMLESAASSAPGPMEAQLRTLIGDGYLSMKNAVSAAREFEKAAEMSGREMERAAQLARAARAYQLAGDTAKARQLWTDLAVNEKNPSIAAEAKVRLGELTAKPAKAS